jgi:3-oxoacyl-[acyl-carrier protein] reductase
VGVARSQAALDELAAEVRAAGQGENQSGGSIETHTCDVGDGAALAALIEKIIETHGRLDILVNNAGITKDGLILRMSDEDWDDVLRVNLRSVFIACRTASRQMMRGKFGRIVNVGSVSGITGNAGQANYAAAKAGLIGLTKTIAKELGPKGVTANVVAPGFIETDMTANLAGMIKEQVLPQIPARRIGQADDIAEAVSYMTSDGAGYLTGQVITVDGGLSL